MTGLNAANTLIAALKTEFPGNLAEQKDQLSKCVQRLQVRLGKIYQREASFEKDFAASKPQQFSTFKSEQADPEA